MNNFWSEEEFIKVVKQSVSIREVLNYFNIPEGTGNYYYKLFHTSVKELNIDISHFTGNNKNFTKIATKDILVKGKYKSTSDLKKRLLKECLLENKCYECGLGSQWNNKVISLQLDHINGDNTDNRLENLRILCPNCHSQTDTFSGSKTKKEKHAHKFICKICQGPKKSSDSNVCTSCLPQVLSGKFKIEWPNPEVVLKMVEENGFTQTSKKLNVSDSAIRKFLKRNKLIGTQ